MRQIGTILSLLLLLGTAGCGQTQTDGQPVTASDFLLDTVVTLSLYPNEAGGLAKEALGDADQGLMQEIFAEIARLEKRLSAEEPGSDLDRLTQNAGKGMVGVSPDTVFLLKESVKYSERTDGAFDVTVGPLVSLWHIRDGEGHVPSREELAAALPLIDYRDVRAENGQAELLREGMKADLGAIAKGYIADQIKAFVLERGVASGIINLGGNVLLIGAKPNGEAFRIGIQDPSGATGTYLGVIAIADANLVSSGSYERFFVQDGKTYHHILDPKTGFPAENELLQVTIISEKSVDGDALSTSCFLLGLAEGMALIEGTPGAEALFVTKDNKIYRSKGAPPLEITNPVYTLEEELP